MEKTKCSECGSYDIVRDSWYLKCNHCKAHFNMDSTGKASQKLDELLDVGITALENEDFRNAASFFKQAMDINPNNGVVYHYYNYSSDNEYLDRGGKRSVEILARGLKGKMGTILDLYHQIADIEHRNEMISEVIDDFDVISRRIATEVFRRDCERDENLSNIDIAYQSSIDRLRENNESNELVIDLSDRYRDYCDKVNDVITEENEAHEQALREIDEFHERMLYGTKEEQAKRAAEEKRRDRAIRIESVCQILLMVASVVFLFLTVFSITKGWGLGSIVFFGIATAASIYGAKEENIFVTLLILVLDYFVMFDFGIGLGFIWRAIIGIILLVLVIRSV